MNLDGQLALMGTAGVLALGGVMLIALFIRRVKARRNAEQMTQTDPNDALIQRIDARLSHHFARIEEQQKMLAVRLQEDIRDLQCDLDWMAGERMIDEAIALARTGEHPDTISRKLDMSLDAAEAIVRFRKH